VSVKLGTVVIDCTDPGALAEFFRPVRGPGKRSIERHWVDGGMETVDE
jgi:hypothetical protein